MRYRKPEELKESGIEWIGKIPKEWDTSKLKYLSQIETGNTPPKNDESNYSENGIPWVKPDDLGEIEPVTTSSEYLSELGTELARVVPKNSVLVGCIGDVGKMGIAGTELTTNQQINAVIFSEKNLISEFGKYLITSSTQEHERYSTKVVVPILKKSNQANIKFPVPPKPEQHSIATFLDRMTEAIDELVQKKEQLIERLKEKRQALITRAVTKGLNPDVPMKDSGIEWLGEIPGEWEVTKVKWLVSKIGSGKTPRGGSEVYKDDGIPFLRSQNIHFDGLRLDDVVYIDEEIHEDMMSTAIKPKDVLLNITGASIGRASLVPEDFPKANLNQHVCILRPRKESISPDYLHLVVSSDIIQNQIFAFENGTSREGLNFSQVGSLLVSLPSLAEQKEIVKQVREYEKSIFSLSAGIENQIEKLKEYRQSLISAAVTGKIDVHSNYAEAIGGEG